MNWWAAPSQFQAVLLRPVSGAASSASGCEQGRAGREGQGRRFPERGHTSVGRRGVGASRHGQGVCGLSVRVAVRRHGQRIGSKTGEATNSHGPCQRSVGHLLENNGVEKSLSRCTKRMSVSFGRRFPLCPGVCFRFVGAGRGRRVGGSPGVQRQGVLPRQVRIRKRDTLSSFCFTEHAVRSGLCFGRQQIARSNAAPIFPCIVCMEMAA